MRFITTPPTRQPRRYADTTGASDGLLSIVDALDPTLQAAFLSAQAALMPSNDNSIWQISDADIFVGLLLWGLYHDRLITSIAPVLSDASRRAQAASGAEPDVYETHAAVQAQAEARVSQVITDTRAALRSAVQQGIADGLSGPQLAARIRPLVGLTARYAQAVTNYEAGLLNQGIPPGRARSMANDYADRLKGVRAKAIAQTELVAATSRGQSMAWEWLIQRGSLNRDEWMQVWRVEHDARLCAICKPFDGVKARIGESFVAPDGSLADAPPLHVACRCSKRLQRLFP